MLSALLLTTISGLSTVIGGLAIYIIKNKNKYYSLGMGFAAGVMIYISFVELLGKSIIKIGYGKSILSFFIGIIIIFLIDILIPHLYQEEKKIITKQGKTFTKSAILITIGIAIHNFPEGIAVFYSSLAGLSFGLFITLAIILHNIPEGFSIAMAVNKATNNRRRAIWFCFISGIAEPIGALLSIIFLYRFIDQNLLNIILAGVAGVMIFISFDELLPQAYTQKSAHLTIGGIISGMAIMSISLYFL
ncbi:MAG: ZIP family metal transporter [Patescibacteria group bacterium]|nr:ZIP family metal transporter [Patescibacteria group bacterium]